MLKAKEEVKQKRLSADFPTSSQQPQQQIATNNINNNYNQQQHQQQYNRTNSDPEIISLEDISDDIDEDSQHQQKQQQNNDHPPHQQNDHQLKDSDSNFQPSHNHYSTPQTTNVNRKDTERRRSSNNEKALNNKNQQHYQNVSLVENASHVKTKNLRNSLVELQKSDLRESLDITRESPNDSEGPLNNTGESNVTGESNDTGESSIDTGESPPLSPMETIPVTTNDAFAYPHHKSATLPGRTSGGVGGGGIAVSQPKFHSFKSKGAPKKPPRITVKRNKENMGPTYEISVQKTPEVVSINRADAIT